GSGVAGVRSPMGCRSSVAAAAGGAPITAAPAMAAPPPRTRRRVSAVLFFCIISIPFDRRGTPTCKSCTAPECAHRPTLCPQIGVQETRRRLLYRVESESRFLAAHLLVRMLRPQRDPR